jgi:hypothetical protein
MGGEERFSYVVAMTCLIVGSFAVLVWRLVAQLKWDALAALTR